MNIKTKSNLELFDYPNIDEALFQWAWRVENTEIDKNSYITFFIKKKSGSYREINRPKLSLFVLQYRLAKFLLSQRRSNLNVSHGFELEKSILTNARIHTCKALVINIDIKDFFKSISRKAIEKIISEKFQPKDYSVEQIANFLTINNHIPTGAPTSPVLSNYACDDIDEDLILLCNNNKVTYSRYADDLTFSTNNQIIIKDFTEEIVRILANYGFKPNKKKIKVYHRNQRQEVTGLTVNEKVNLSRQFRYNLKAIFHNFKKKGFKETSDAFQRKYPNKGFYSTLEGWVNHYGFIKGKNDKNYLKYKKLLFGISYGERAKQNGLEPDEKIEQLKFLIESCKNKISIENKISLKQIEPKQVIELFIENVGIAKTKKNWEDIIGGYLLCNPEENINVTALYNYFFIDHKGLMNEIIK